MKERFGIEIEYCSSISRDAIQRMFIDNDIPVLSGDQYRNTEGKWIVSYDGSIRVRNSGDSSIEIKTPPMRVHEMDILKKVMRLIKQHSESYVNTSCGLHTHVEIDGWKSIKNVYAIWSKFEDEICSFFPMSRRQNHFCGKIKGNLRSLRLRADQMRPNSERYSMVNSQCFTRIGTIEFRGHGGTLNYIKMKRWVLFVTKIVEVAKEMTDEEVRKELRKKDVDLWAFLKMNGRTKRYFEGRKKHFEVLQAVNQNTDGREI